jgi:hypothetical protein
MKNNKLIKNKKALSLMVEYVLLVTFSVVLAIIVFAVLKTYVPQDKIACPEGTSLLVESYSYDCSRQILTFDISNSGRFDIGGYFIYVSDRATEELPTLDISLNNTDDPPDPRLNALTINGIKLGMDGAPGLTQVNDFGPGEVESERYDISQIDDKAYILKIVPMRWQTERNTNKLVSCADEAIVKNIYCD